MPGKSGNLRDKLEDDVLDLSLNQLTDVPVNEIARITKGTTLDLSNNLLTTLPENFSELSHLVKLDLSKNQLFELPEYFGHLKNLQHLDLYSNKLQRLPMSFGQLKNLKWLDLKNNPLVPQVQQAAGPCVTKSDCINCAKKVVALMQSMQSQFDRERSKMMLETLKAKEEQRLAEEQERERLRAEKRAAKERRRDEARAREEVKKKMTENVMLKGQHGVERSGNVHTIKNSNGNSATNQHQRREEKGPNSSFKWGYLLIPLVALILGIATSLLWIYTEGHLDQRSIERALPAIQRDLEEISKRLSRLTESWITEAMKLLRPWLNTVATNVDLGLKELKRRNDLVAYYINDKFGHHFCYIKKFLAEQSDRLRPYFQSLGEMVIQTWHHFNSWTDNFLIHSYNATSAWIQKTFQTI